MTKKAVTNPVYELVKTSGVKDLIWARNIATRYAEKMTEVESLAAEVEAMDPENPEFWDRAREIRILCGTERSSLKEFKKEDKNDLTIKTKYIDGLFNAVEGKLSLVQNAAKEVEKFQENLEAERLKVVKETRLAQIGEMLLEEEIPEEIEKMTDNAFSIFLAGVTANYEKEQAAIKKAEEERIKREKEEALRKELQEKRSKELAIYWATMPEQYTDFDYVGASEEEYQKMLKEAKKAKVEKDAENERIRKENERLAAERRKKEAKEAAEKAERLRRQQVLSPYLIFIRDYESTISLEPKLFEKEIVNLEKAKKQHEQAEEKKRKEAEKEKARLAKIEADLLEKKRQEQKRLDELKRKQEKEARAKEEERKAPERQRLINFINSATYTLDTPVLKDEELNKVLKLAKEKMDSMKKWLIKQI